MKLKYELSFLNMDDEMMAVPLESDEVFRGVLRMNGTTLDILKKLEKETSEDTVVAELFREYDAEEADIRESVSMVIEQLRENGLLEE